MTRGYIHIYIYIFPLYPYYTTILVSKIPLLLDCMPFTNQINESTRSFFNISKQLIIHNNPFVSAKLSMFSLGEEIKVQEFPSTFQTEMKTRPKSSLFLLAKSFLLLLTPCFHYSCPHFKPWRKDHTHPKHGEAQSVNIQIISIVYRI